MPAQTVKAVPLLAPGAKAVIPGGPEANPVPLSRSDMAAYKAAFKFAEKKNWIAAHRRAARGRHPLPRKILRWLEMTISGNSYSFSKIVDFVNRNPDWPLPNTLRNRAEEAITETTPPQTVLAWFANRPPRTTDGKIAYGQALIATGRVDEGYTHLRDAWVYGRFNRRDEVLFMRQYRKRFTEADHWLRLDNLLWNGHHRQARRMLRRVSSGHRALGMARMQLRRRRGGVDGAISRVPAWLRRDPGLLYERLRWRRRKGRDLDALEILKSPPAHMVRPELWSKERVILARRLLANGLITDAYQAVRDHGLDLRHTAELAEAEWLAGWIALRYMNQAKEAQQRFEALYRAVQFPVSKARAAYWAGRASKAIGDTSQASDWFQIAAYHPTTYHGQLATQELGEKIHPSPEPIAPNEAEKQQFQNHELTHAVRLLNQLDQRKHVRRFLLRLSQIGTSPGHRILAGDLAHSIGRLDLAVWVARYAQRDGAIFLSMGYPLYQMPEGNPERALLLAVARQESNFYAHAISRAGAQGIMQLMPRTARRVARSSGIRYSRTRLTSDPGYNVSLGRRYLRQMLSKFSGSYVLSIAAYNAGPTAVARWLRKNGDPRNGIDDPIDWIELIPFQETRTYVQRVLGNLQVFRNRLQPGRMAVTLDRDLRR
jgi:soluble lytic murein transglycosylase